MRYRPLLSALVLICIVAPLTSCTSPSLTSIVIAPTAYTAELGPCGTPQVVANFTAMGYYTHPGHEPTTKDITNQVTWYSYDTQLVTISSSGVASVTTCATPGSTFEASVQISATAPGFHGEVASYATFSEVQPATSSLGTVKSLVITRSSQAVSSHGTVQFTAMGKTAEGSLVRLAAQPSWTSTDNQVATIDRANGSATTLGEGKSTIVAVFTNPDGTTAIGTTHLDVAAGN